MSLIVGTAGAIATAAVTVSKVLEVVGLAVQGLKVIGNAIVAIVKALGNIQPDRDVEEIGDRALQAEEQGMTCDKYASYEAWVSDIEKDDWGYDPEKNKDMAQDKKILKGVEVATAVTMEQFPELPISDFFSLAGNNQDFFTIKRMDAIGKLADMDRDAFGKVVNYVTGAAEDHTTVDEATDILMDIEKTIQPGISDDMAYDKVALFKRLK